MISSVDCLVVLGHSIESVTNNGVTVCDDHRQWAPTRLIQERNEKGYRTGIRNWKLRPDDESAYIGGGNLVTLAATQFIETREFPKLLVFAAGRPFYLKEANTPPLLNEGVFMKTSLIRKLSSKSQLHAMTVLSDNKNTKDDIEKPLSLAFERGWQSVEYLMLGMRIPRAEAFLLETLKSRPALQEMTTSFLPAEDLVRERYVKSPVVLAMFEALLKRIEGSRAFQKTMQDEQGGIAALQKEEYKGTGNY